MAGKQGMKRYPAETKLEAIRLFYEEGKTRAEISQLLNVRDPKRVKAWLRQYRSEGAVGFSKAQGRPPNQDESPEVELKRLRMENDLLKKFHAELRTAVLAKRNIGSSIIIERNTG